MIAAEEKKKILLIDDDETHLSTVENMLMSEYEIITAKSGTEALLVLYKGVVPNLVLLDIVMSEKDGWETYNRIRAITLLHEVPIAFFTSSNDEEEVEHVQIAGAADFITKPYNPEELIKRVKAIISK